MRGEGGCVERSDGGRVEATKGGYAQRAEGGQSEAPLGGGPAARFPFSAASLQTQLLRVADGGASGPLALAIGGGLRSLSWLYLTATETNVLAHRVGMLRREQAPCPVIAVGNLSVGGTGKSTATAAIARWLREAGLRPAILSRGYGTRNHTPVRVVSDGSDILLDAENGGDEPVMLARHLAGVPVLIGRRRPLSAGAAVRDFGANVCLLDDGFQVWNLRKDLEIVLLDGRRPFDNGYVLPRGMLREPPEHLARADVVILMETDDVAPEALAALRQRVASLAPHALLAEACREPERLWNLATGAELPFSALSGLPVVALSAIGNPGGFEALLAGQGAEVHPARLPDHHPYERGDLEWVQEVAAAAGAAAIITTEKDAVKLDACSGAGLSAMACPTAAGAWAPSRDGSRAQPEPSLDAGPVASGEPRQVPIWVLSIRLRFTAGGDALRERILSVARRGR